MKKIFIDCGANRGQSAKAWLKHIPTEQHHEWEIHCFEASKKLYPTLERKISELQSQFNNSKKNITCHNKAVWIDNDGVQFHDMGNESSSTDARKTGINEDKMKTVESINLSEFIKSHSKDDLIILKMDIEGGEYTIIPHLHETGALEYVSTGFFELHAAKMLGTTIETDYNILRILKENDLDSYYWSAEYTKRNDTPTAYDRVVTKESIVKEWKRKKRI